MKVAFLQPRCMKVAFLQDKGVPAGLLGEQARSQYVGRGWNGMDQACKTAAVQHFSVIIIDRRVG
jgi:hypothetical protein